MNRNVVFMSSLQHQFDAVMCSSYMRLMGLGYAD